MWQRQRGNRPYSHYLQLPKRCKHCFWPRSISVFVSFLLTFLYVCEEKISFLLYSIIYTFCPHPQAVSAAGWNHSANHLQLHGINVCVGGIKEGCTCAYVCVPILYTVHLIPKNQICKDVFLNLWLTLSSFSTDNVIVANAWCFHLVHHVHVFDQ